MELQTETPSRKRRSSPLRGEIILRRHVLAQLRREVARLHRAGHSTAIIARELGISARDARAFAPRQAGPVTATGLPERAIAALLHGRHAHLGGDTEAARIENLARIASRYSRSELLAEDGVGIVTAMKIEIWLERQGLNLRSP